MGLEGERREIRVIRQFRSPGRSVEAIQGDLVELRRMRRFLDHSERELTVELWEAMETSFAEELAA